MKQKNSEELEDALSSVFMTPHKFSMEVEKMVAESDGATTYIEAVAELVEKYQIDYDKVSSLILRSLKEKLRYDAVRLKYLKEKPPQSLPE